MSELTLPFHCGNDCSDEDKCNQLHWCECCGDCMYCCFNEWCYDNCDIHGAAVDYEKEKE